MDDTCRRSPTDLIFVVERPGDDNSENMKNLKGFLSRMTEVVDMDDEHTRYRF